MKKNQELRERLSEMNAELLYADGYDNCIIGLSEDGMHVVYDSTKMMETLLKENESDGMTEADAWDYLGFNTFSAYVGECTPIYITRIKDLM